MRGGTAPYHLNDGNVKDRGVRPCPAEMSAHSSAGSVVSCDDGVPVYRSTDRKVPGFTGEDVALAKEGHFASQISAYGNHRIIGSEFKKQVGECRQPMEALGLSRSAVKNEADQLYKLGTSYPLGSPKSRSSGMPPAMSPSSTRPRSSDLRNGDHAGNERQVHASTIRSKDYVKHRRSDEGGNKREKEKERNGMTEKLPPDNTNTFFQRSLSKYDKTITEARPYWDLPLYPPQITPSEMIASLPQSQRDHPSSHRPVPPLLDKFNQSDDRRGGGPSSIADTFRRSTSPASSERATSHRYWTNQQSSSPMTSSVSKPAVPFCSILTAPIGGVSSQLIT